MKDRITQFAPLVKYLAQKAYGRIPHDKILRVDLEQAGYIGLIEACDKQDVSKAGFRSYAYKKIKFAIIDFLREFDPLSKEVRKKIKDLENAICKCEQNNRRAANINEVAGAAGMSIDRVSELFHIRESSRFISYESDPSSIESALSDFRHEPLSILIEVQNKQLLISAIDSLPDRLRTIMGLMYEHELNLRQTGEVLGVSESRVCQMHSKAIKLIKRRIMH